MSNEDVMLAREAVQLRIVKALEIAAVFTATDRESGTKGFIANWLTFGNLSVSGAFAETRVGALANLATELRRQFALTAAELGAK